MVATTQIIGSGRAGGKKDVLAFAGLHDDFGVFVIERFRFVELCRGEERRRREFVELLTTVFEKQLRMDAMLQTQIIRRKSIVDHRDVEPDRIRRCGAAGPDQSDQ